jgi:Kdo2-lipid IVA lauroyltransferase/acyltransferase
MLMTEPNYSFRANAFTPERTYRLGSDALHWASRYGKGSILYRDVLEVRVSRGLMRGDAALKARTMQRLQLRAGRGQRMTLSPLHYARLGAWEDRSEPFRFFAGTALARIREIKPDLRITNELHWKLRLRNGVTRSMPSVLGWIGVALLKMARLCGLEMTSRATIWLMRGIGPWLPAHRIGVANLKAAFPEKSEEEVHQLLQAVWSNLGRVIAEFPFLNELCDYDPHSPAKSQLVFDQDTLDRVRDLKLKGTPALFFGAHIANWEMVSLAGTLGIPLTAIYRSSKSAALNDLITRIRHRIKLVPADFGAASEIVDALRHGSSIGMLVDQHFTNGADVTFFGRPCKVNPTLAKLARKSEYPIYGANVSRLPNGRFRCYLTPALDCPRDPDGKIDVIATMQTITNIVETWVRTHPDQWLWLHRRWR